MATSSSPTEHPAMNEADWSRGLIALVRSPDRAGIVASLAASIQAAGGNIVELDQHTDVVEGDFGCRIEVDAGVDAQQLAASLNELSSSLSLHFTMMPVARPLARVAVLCSSTLHCPSDLIARSAIGQLACDVIALVSDRTEARELAERYG